MPIRDEVLYKGTKYNNYINFKHTPAVTLTLDNYLQYYDKKITKKYETYPSSVLQFDIFQKKPTYLVKFNSFKVTKKGYNLYFKHPIKYFKTKKINQNKYLLKIQKKAQKHKYWTWGEDFEGADWTEFKVGNHPFYIVDSIESGD